MAFCALFHHFVPDQIPYETLDPKNRVSLFNRILEQVVSVQNTVFINLTCGVTRKIISSLLYSLLQYAVDILIEVVAHTATRIIGN